MIPSPTREEALAYDNEIHVRDSNRSGKETADDVFFYDGVGEDAMFRSKRRRSKAQSSRSLEGKKLSNENIVKNRIIKTAGGSIVTRVNGPLSYLSPVTENPSESCYKQVY